MAAEIKNSEVLKADIVVHMERKYDPDSEHVPFNRVLMLFRDPYGTQV